MSSQTESKPCCEDASTLFKPMVLSEGLGLLRHLWDKPGFLIKVQMKVLFAEVNDS